MDQLGLEDLEVDQRVDLLRTRTRGFNLRPQYYITTWLIFLFSLDFICVAQILVKLTNQS